MTSGTRYFVTLESKNNLFNLFSELLIRKVEDENMKRGEKELNEIHYI